MRQLLLNHIVICLCPVVIVVRIGQFELEIAAAFAGGRGLQRCCKIIRCKQAKGIAPIRHGRIGKVGQRFIAFEGDACAVADVPCDRAAARNIDFAFPLESYVVVQAECTVDSRIVHQHAIDNVVNIFARFRAKGIGKAGQIAFFIRLRLSCSDTVAVLALDNDLAVQLDRAGGILPIQLDLAERIRQRCAAEVHAREDIIDGDFPIDVTLAILREAGITGFEHLLTHSIQVNRNRGVLLPAFPGDMHAVAVAGR